jgi:hypothetical protein
MTPGTACWWWNRPNAAGETPATAAGYSGGFLFDGPGPTAVDHRTVAGGTGRRGEALWELLDAAVRDRGIPVRFGTTAERLIVDGADEDVNLTAEGW